MSATPLDLRKRAEELARALLRRVQEDNLGPWTGDEFVRQQTEINYAFALQVQRETVQACADEAREFGRYISKSGNQRAHSRIIAGPNDQGEQTAERILALLPVRETMKEGRASVSAPMVVTDAMVDSALQSVYSDERFSSESVWRNEPMQKSVRAVAQRAIEAALAAREP